VGFLLFAWCSANRQAGRGDSETKILARTLKRDVVAFVFYCSICSGQNYSGDAIFEKRLMKIDQQPDRNIQQFHVAEELRFAKRMQNLDCF